MAPCIWLPDTCGTLIHKLWANYNVDENNENYPEAYPDTDLCRRGGGAAICHFGKFSEADLGKRERHFGKFLEADLGEGGEAFWKIFR